MVFLIRLTFVKRTFTSGLDISIKVKTVNNIPNISDTAFSRAGTNV